MIFYMLLNVLFYFILYQKRYPKTSRREHLFTLCSSPVPQGCFGRSLGSFWHPVGSVLVAVGTLLNPVWIFLASKHPFRHPNLQTPSSKELHLTTATCGTLPQVNSINRLYIRFKCFIWICFTYVWAGVQMYAYNDAHHPFWQVIPCRRSTHAPACAITVTSGLAQRVIQTWAFFAVGIPLLLWSATSAVTRTDDGKNTTGWRNDCQVLGIPSVSLFFRDTFVRNIGCREETSRIPLSNCHSSYVYKTSSKIP